MTEQHPDPDTAARQRHLRHALGHVLLAVAFTEGMAAGRDTFAPELYRQRGELKTIAETLHDLIGETE